jgi:hypothetical protein
MLHLYPNRCRNHRTNPNSGRARLRVCLPKPLARVCTIGRHCQHAAHPTRTTASRQPTHWLPLPHLPRAPFHASLATPRSDSNLPPAACHWQSPPACSKSAQQPRLKKGHSDRLAPPSIIDALTQPSHLDCPTTHVHWPRRATMVVLNAPRMPDQQTVVPSTPFSPSYMNPPTYCPCCRCRPLNW